MRCVQSHSSEPIHIYSYVQNQGADIINYLKQIYKIWKRFVMKISRVEQRTVRKQTRKNNDALAKDSWVTPNSIFNHL